MAQNTGKEMYKMLYATGDTVIEMKTNNPLLCDPETGICELPMQRTAGVTSVAELASEKPVKIIYYTDPICSSCWGIEPQLRKLKLEYGHSIDIEYRMGGLLPDWSYNSGGISKPSDVAHHWDEVSLYYDMPIDGDVWLEDPLHSSYPPSIAFKAAQLQDKDKAVLFLREMRELLFLQKKNITRWEHLEAAAEATGLNSTQLKTDYESKAVALFQDDLALAKKMGVRGFPSIFFTDANGHQEFVYGTKPYEAYENALLKLYPQAKKKTYGKQLKDLFSKFQSLTAKEFSELSGMDRTETETMLNDLAATAVLQKLDSKNGAIWKLQK
jgi:putative protein-disulfide isomerase